TPGPGVGLRREQAVEERAVPRQRDTQVLRRDVLAAVPLRLEARALLAETRGQLLHQLPDELVGLLDLLTGLIDEPRLQVFPAAAKPLCIVAGQQRGSLVVVCLRRRTPRLGRGSVA